MGAFSRSWDITKLTFNVIMKDKELIAFPILSGIFSLMFIAAMVIPTLLETILENSEMNYAPMFYLVIFIIYLGLAFIATFFNTCVVYTAKKRFSGGDALFMESLKFAFSKVHMILAWSLVSATVGLLLRLIERAFRRAGIIGQLIGSILVSLFGLAWSILTLFVVPVMVYKDVGPIDAIKISVATLKKTWGESLIRHFGLGIAQFMFIVIGLLVFIPLLILTAATSGVTFLIVIVCAVVYIVLIAILFSLANTVFNTALFEYAATGNVPTGYSEEVLKATFESKEGIMR